MKKKSRPSSPVLPISIMWLSIALIAILGSIFTHQLLNNSSSSTPVQTTPASINNTFDLDTLLKDLDGFDTTSQINSELLKLSSDAAGI